MVERARTTYARLFEVRVLHHYWLDEGATDVDALDGADRQRRLLDYDVRRILRLEPSAATGALIAGLRGVVRTTTLGVVVAVPVDAVVPLDATFELWASPVDPGYADYTALTLRATPIIDVVDPAEPERIRRFTAGVPVVSNATGVSRGTGAAMRRFLSTDYVTGASAGDAIEALVVSGSTLRLLTGDPPAPTRSLGPVGARPVYLHQGDVPAAGVELPADAPRDVAVVIRIVPRRTGSTAFDIVEPDGTPRVPSRVFELHVRNRWTTRRYRDARSGAVTSTEGEDLPLTRHGNAGAKRPPAPSSLEPELDPADPARIVRLVSDVFA